MAQTEDNLLQQIQSRFDELFALHGEIPSRTMSDINSNPNLLKDDFNKYGFAIISDALKSDAFERNQEALIRELSLHLFNTQDPLNNEDFVKDYHRITKKYPNLSILDQKIATLSSWWNAHNGFGNCNFRFLYFRFLKNNPMFQIDTENIEFSRNPFHRWSLRLMAEHPDIWNILKSFHGPDDHPMISWDSQKIRFQDTGRPLSNVSKSTKPTLTTPHRDVYINDGVSLDRIQAMLIQQDPRAIALGWVMFSHDPIIQQLTSLLLNKKSDGFSTINNERLIEIMGKYWRAPLGGFVVWKQETVHYEGIPTSDRKLQSFDQTSDSLNHFSYRIVMGTHIPVGLTPQALKQLAFLCEHGWCPEIYLKNKSHNRGTKVAINVVNRKTTQYAIPRTMSHVEITNLENINYNPDHIDQTIHSLPEIIKEFYGLY